MGKFIKIYRNADLWGEDPKTGENKLIEVSTLIELVRVEDVIKVFMDGGMKNRLHIVMYDTKKENYYTWEEKHLNEAFCKRRIDELLKLLNEE